MHLSQFSYVQLFWPPGLYPDRLLCPRASLGKNKYCNGLLFPPPGDLSTPGMEPMSYVFCIGRCVLYQQCHLENPFKSACYIKWDTELGIVPSSLKLQEQPESSATLRASGGGAILRKGLTSFSRIHPEMSSQEWLCNNSDSVYNPETFWQPPASESPSVIKMEESSQPLCQAAREVPLRQL